MVSIKEVIALFLFIAAFTPARADDHNPELEARMDLLSAEVRRLAKQNLEQEKIYLELQAKNSELEKMLSDKMRATATSMFDCHLTDSWSMDGPIVFNGCEG